METEQRSIQDGFPRITGRSIAEEASTPFADSNEYDRQLVQLAQPRISRDEDSLIRKLILNCMEPNKKSLFGATVKPHYLHTSLDTKSDLGPR